MTRPESQRPKIYSPRRKAQKQAVQHTQLELIQARSEQLGLGYLLFGPRRAA